MQMICNPPLYAESARVSVRFERVHAGGLSWLSRLVIASA